MLIPDHRQRVVGAGCELLVDREDRPGIGDLGPVVEIGVVARPGCDDECRVNLRLVQDVGQPLANDHRSGGRLEHGTSRDIRPSALDDIIWIGGGIIDCIPAARLHDSHQQGLARPITRRGHTSGRLAEEQDMPAGPLRNKCPFGNRAVALAELEREEGVGILGVGVECDRWHVRVRQMTVVTLGAGEARDRIPVRDRVSAKAGGHLHNHFLVGPFLLPLEEEYSGAGRVGFLRDGIPLVHVSAGAARRTFNDADAVGFAPDAGPGFNLCNVKARVLRRKNELDSISESDVFVKNWIAVVPRDGDRRLQSAEGKTPVFVACDRE